MNEVELKLDLTPDAVAALDKSALFAGKSHQIRQRSIYFDTPDQALAAAGLTLRIRRAGRTRVQTAKAGDGHSAGLFARKEWERRVASDTPVLDDATPVPAVLGRRADDLVALFEVRIERRIWNLDHGSEAIELALDHGEAVAGKRRAPIDEVELELKDGAPRALFALAREIAAQVPVRLGVLSKAERGYRLLAAAGSAAKAGRMHLDPATTAADSLRLIADNCIRQYRLNEMRLLEHHDREALHQARVALRRLRSALSIHRKLLADDRFDHFQHEARWLLQELGEARNLHVLIARSEDGPLRAKLEQALADADCRIDAAIGSARARAFPLDLSDWLVTGRWRTDSTLAARRDEPASSFAASALDRLRRQVKKRGRHLTEIDDTARHRVRKTAKKLRYAAEFYASLFDTSGEERRRERFVATLKKLQDHLGTLNDLAVAPAILERLELSDEPGAAALLGHGRKPQLRSAADAYRALAETRRFWR